MLSGPLPTFAVTLSLLDVQNNSELVGPFMSALSTTCGTNLCTAATTLQACFPPSVQVMSLTVALTYALVFQHMFSAPSCYTTLMPTTAAPEELDTGAPAQYRPQVTKTTGLRASASAVMMLASVVVGSTTNGAPSIQRSASVLNIAVRCISNEAVRVAHIINTTATTNDDQLFKDVLDNPLVASIPVGSTPLEYAAGASVVNFGLVGAAGIVLHGIAVAQRNIHCRQDSSLLVRLANMVPSSRLPGALAVAYGILVQPSVSACIALIVSPEHTLSSVVCGAAMLCAWLLYPAYCVVMILWRARDDGSFLLQTTVHPNRIKKITGRYIIAVASALLNDSSLRIATKRNVGRHQHRRQ